MQYTHTQHQEDVWSRWFMRSQVGANDQYRQQVLKVVERIRNRVLDGARLRTGMTLLDVGTGYGLIALGAIERIGPSLHAIMTDLSEPLLSAARSAARASGVESQCSFLQCSAETLQGVDDESVDVVCTRAVLAFVPNKPLAARQFFRVLRPGGRLSIAEPIFQDDAFKHIAMTRLIADQPSLPNIEFLRLLQRWRSFQFPSTEADMHRRPETSFSERDLVDLALDAGFVEIHMELHLDIVRGTMTDWELFLDLTPLPKTPNLRQILAAHFSSQERALFERNMRPRIESGEALSSEVTAYLTALKPSVSVP